MQQTLTASKTARNASTSHVDTTHDESIDELPSSCGFAALLAAFHATGGTAKGDDLARLMADHGTGDFVGLARLIAAGDVFGFEWRGTLWIPMFQFEPRDLSINPASRAVLAELGSAFDGWARAAWFAQPNCWLQHRTPVDLLGTELSEVLGAARTDRFIAVG